MQRQCFCNFTCVNFELLPQREALPASFKGYFINDKFLHKFVTFIWSRDVFHSVPIRLDPACSRRDPVIVETIFPALIFLEIKNVWNVQLLQLRSCLIKILSLKKQRTRAAWKKILPMFPNILKRNESTWEGIHESSAVNQQSY